MTLLKSITINPLKAHTSTIIFLHGLGDTGDGWSSIASVFSPQLPNTKFIFPHSPHKPVTLNGGMMMPAWYDIKSLGGQSNSMLEDKTGMYDSVAQIMELVENEMHIVGGFSQGGAMTLLTGIKCKVEFAGLVCLSGYLPLHQLVSDIQTEVNLHTPIFMGHGTQDQVVAHSWGMKSMQTLKSFGYKPEWHSYQGMGHSSCDEEITDVLKFLMARLA